MPGGGPALEARSDGEPERLVIWRFSDGKPGHDNQSLGLAEALGRLVESEIVTLPPISIANSLFEMLPPIRVRSTTVPDPDLILGSGHATHLSLLTTRRVHGGRTVVLMNPTLPKRLFDLCLIPEHDRPRPDERVIATRGALNRVRPSASKRPDSGLVLVGGPSRHVIWSDDTVLDQIRAVLAGCPGIDWTIATSRRTPPAFSAKTSALKADNVCFKPAEATPPGWLAGELGCVETVWVTEDSASMVYEALTGGAAVGLLSVASMTPGRISQGIDTLVRDGVLTRFADWTNGRFLAAPKVPLDEATRCARLILDRWPELGSRGSRVKTF